MPVEIWDSRFLTPAQAEALGELIARVWPKPNVSAEDRARQQLAIGRGYDRLADHAPRSFVVCDEGRVVAHAAILPQTIRTSAGEMTIGGLARVGADPALRGHGLGELVVRAALATVDAGEFPFGLFQTNHGVRPFYEKLGAVTVDNQIVNSLADDPTAPAFWDEIAMRYPGNGDWPAGTIDLLGPGY